MSVDRRTRAERAEDHLPPAALDTLRALEEAMGLEPGEWAAFAPYWSTFSFLAWARLTDTLREESARADHPADRLTVTEARREAARRLGVSTRTMIRRLTEWTEDTE